jgi:hypothetical protein
MNLTVHPTTTPPWIGQTGVACTSALVPDRPSAGRMSLPDDLREWLNHQSLVDLTVRAVLSLDHPPAIPAVPAARTSAPPHATLLLLLTYCYAAGIYSSEAIENQLKEEPAFRRLCGGDPPDAADLRRFRRTHRSEVEHCLGALLWSACRSEWHQLSGRCHSLSEGDPVCRSDQGIEEPLRRIIERDVNRRVNWAVQLDSMALDC